MDNLKNHDWTLHLPSRTIDSAYINIMKPCLAVRMDFFSFTLLLRWSTKQIIIIIIITKQERSRCFNTYAIPVADACDKINLPRPVTWAQGLVVRYKSRGGERNSMEES